jgi:catechol 2,3-dioxygenase-like lactoylglutathione lyase family enzyme
MTKIDWVRALPVLPVTDVKTATAFYRDNLGFEVRFDMGDYAGVGRGSIEIHLDGSASRPAPGISCRIDVRGIDALYAEIEPKGVVKPDEKLETKPWGMRQFSVLDAAGNRLTFTEPVGQRSA